MVASGIAFGIQLVTALAHAPSMLLALAAAPLLQRGRLAALLFAVDLALLLELVAIQSGVDDRFGEALAARGLAAGVHVALACFLIRIWQGSRLQADGAGAHEPA